MTGGSTTSPRISRPSLPPQPDAEPRPARHVAVLRYLFAALLLLTGGLKLVDFPGFVEVVDSYRFFPDLLLVPASAAVAGVELVLGLSLLLGLRLVHAALATVLLHVGYLIWLGIALARGLSIDNCGCFGVYLARRLSWTMLVEDSILLAAATILYLGLRRRAAG